MHSIITVVKAGAIVRFAVVGVVIALLTFAFLWPQDRVLGEGTATEQWVTRYDGPAGGSDQARDLAIDDLGNVYVTGVSGGSGTGRDYATIKYGPDGSELWVARYDDPTSTDDVATALAVDRAGNVIVTGTSNSSAIDAVVRAVTVKYGPDGSEQWVSRYDGGGTDQLAVDEAGNVFVAVRSRGASDIVVIKYGPDGDEQWVARYSTTSQDESGALAADDAGNVYVTGQSGQDFVTIKYGPDGNELWISRYGGSTPGKGSDIAIDGAGNVFVSGWSGAADNWDFVTIKYGPDGSELWVAIYDGGEDDWSVVMVLDGEDGVYVTGGSVDSTDDASVTTIKYGSDGNEEWVARYDGAFGYYLALAADGNIHVAASIWRGDGTVVIQYGPDGNELQATHLGEAIERPRYNGFRGLAIDEAANVYVTGYAAGCGTGLDYVTIKYQELAPKRAATESPPTGCSAPTNPPVGAPASISIENGRAVPNGRGTAKLVARGVPEPGLGAWTVDIFYDDSILWGATDCGPPPGLNSVCNPSFTRASARVAGADALGRIGDFVLAEFTFLCLGDEGTSELRLSYSTFADSTIGDPQPIDVTLVDGTFECTYDAPSLFLSSSDYRPPANETVTITARAWNNEEGIPLAGLECIFTIENTGQYDGLPGGSIEPTIETGPVTTDANGMAISVLSTGDTASAIGLLVECDDMSATLGLHVIREPATTLPQTGFAQISQQGNELWLWVGALVAGGLALAVASRLLRSNLVPPAGLRPVRPDQSNSDGVLNSAGDGPSDLRTGTSDDDDRP